MNKACNTTLWFTSDHTSRTWSDLSVVIMLSDILYPFMRKTSNGTSWHFTQLVSCCAESKKPLNRSVFTSWGSCPTVSTSIKIHYKLPLTQFDFLITYNNMTLSRSELWTSCQQSQQKGSSCGCHTGQILGMWECNVFIIPQFKSLHLIHLSVSSWKMIPLNKSDLWHHNAPKLSQ